jgi:hypothetical protein
MVDVAAALGRLERTGAAMASLDHKIQLALNEARILVLVTQVLIGFAYRSSFEPVFDRLPPAVQYLKLSTLALELVVVALLMLCAAYHRIVARGESTPDVQRFCSRVIELALFPFAVALGLDVYVVVGRQAGGVAGLLAGLGALVVALWFWYGLGAWERRRRRRAWRGMAAAGQGRREEATMSGEQQASGGHGTKLAVRIEQVLTEARMVLPGVQALLGFQLASMLMEGFDKLPEASKYVHLASLGFIAIAAILLMTPAAYHRIVEEGEDSEPFFRFASRMVLAAMVPLALGVAGDFYVVAAKVTGSPPLAGALATLVLGLFYGLWFGYTFYRRRRRRVTAVRGRRDPAGAAPSGATAAPPVSSHQRSA